MNTEDLVVRVNLSLSGWLRSRDRLSHPLTRAAHVKLLRAVKTGSRSTEARGRSAVVDRASMLREVSAIARRLVDRAIEDLATLKQDGCRYAFQDQIEGEITYRTMEFDEVPWPGSALQVMQMATSLRTLPAEQQHLVAGVYLAEDQLALSVLHEQFAREDGPPEKATWHSLKAAAARKIVGDLRGRLSAATTNWLQQHPDPFPPGWWEEYPMPVDVPVSASASDLEKVAGWYREFGLRLFQPMELDERALPQSVAIWRRHWKRAEDCGDGFILLSGWLGCLAQTEDSRRCTVCYRHIDEAAGMRKFCSKHARRAGKQKDLREMHVSRLYQMILRRRLRKGQDLKTLLSAEGWPKGDHEIMVKHAKADRLPDPLVAPAATLALFLRALIPLLSEPLGRKVKIHFEDVLHTACVPFIPLENKQLTIETLHDQRRAAFWLGWETFFRTWYGKDTEKQFKPAAKLGLGLDVHHPLLRGPGIRPSKIAQDLVRYRIWSAIDEVFDLGACSNPDEVVRLRDGGVPECPDQGPRTFREIGRLTGMSAEAAHKAYLWAKDHPNSPARRKRIIPERLRILERRLIGELL